MLLDDMNDDTQHTEPAAMPADEGGAMPSGDEAGEHEHTGEDHDGAEHTA